MVRKTQAAPKIFLSYSHKDREFGIKLVQSLRKTIGCEEAVWYDEGLRAGDQWWTKIMRELANSNIFIVILSQNSIKSAWVREEILTAWKRHLDNKMQFAPVLYHTYKKLPSELAFLDNRQFISFLSTDNYEFAYEKLITALNIVNGENKKAEQAKDKIFHKIGPASSPAELTIKPNSLKLLCQIIEESYQKQDWYSVIIITNIIIRYYSKAATDAIYKNREFAYLYMYTDKMDNSKYSLAEYTLKKALALINDTEPRLDLLDAYALTLLEQNLQEKDLVMCIEEARKLSPDNVHWKELQNSLPLIEIKEKKHSHGFSLLINALILIPIGLFIVPIFRHIFKRRYSIERF